MKPRKSSTPHLSVIFALLIHILSSKSVKASHEDCPWFQNDAEVPNNVKSHCICATNPSSNNQLSIQCQDINTQELVDVLSKFEAQLNGPLELLYLNGSKVADSNGMIPPRIFKGIEIVRIKQA
jgi:hypothetical protein